jgi:ADP-ribose pyrophosphatase YjhB (NUDIX family)
MMDEFTYSTQPRFCHQCGGPLRERLLETEERPRLVCERCDFVHYINPRVVVGVIHERRSRLLLLRRAIEPRYGAWTFPAGFMEVDETPQEGAQREAAEEVGVSVEIGPLLGLYSRPGLGILVIVFRGKASADTPKLSRESLEVRWFGADEIPWPELAFDTTEWALRDWVALKTKRKAHARQRAEKRRRQ